MLDYTRKEMVITTRLQATGAARPATVWIWAFFISPTEAVQGSRSDQPIETRVNWNGRDTATVTVRGSFHWVTNAGSPRRGYLARVSVSDVSAEAVQIRASLRDKSPKGMVTVVSKL